MLGKQFKKGNTFRELWCLKRGSSTPWSPRLFIFEIMITFISIWANKTNLTNKTLWKTFRIYTLYTCIFTFNTMELAPNFVKGHDISITHNYIPLNFFSLNYFRQHVDCRLVIDLIYQLKANCCYIKRLNLKFNFKCAVIFWEHE